MKEHWTGTVGIFLQKLQLTCDNSNSDCSRCWFIQTRVLVWSPRLRTIGSILHCILLDCINCMNLIKLEKSRKKKDHNNLRLVHYILNALWTCLIRMKPWVNSNFWDSQGRAMWPECVNERMFIRNECSMCSRPILKLLYMLAGAAEQVRATWLLCIFISDTLEMCFT